MNSAIVRYHGGKFRVANWIIGNMMPHRCYIEPFGGGGSVLLRKPPAMTEVYNDLDDQIFNLFWVIRNHPEQLEQALRNTIYARREYELSRKPSEDRIENARRVIVHSHMAFSTTNTDANTGFRAAINCTSYTSQVSTFNKLNDLVAPLKKRLERVIIENRDAFDIMDAFDLPTTLAYLDPPYMPETRSKSSMNRGYRLNFTREDHVRLLERAKKFSGMVIISGYENELYNDMLPGWNKAYKKSATDSLKQKTEVLYMNYKTQKLF